jgi:uncharacterized membrane protein
MSTQASTLTSINFDDPIAVLLPILTVPVLITLKALLQSSNR